MVPYGLALLLFFLLFQALFKPAIDLLPSSVLQFQKR